MKRFSLYPILLALSLALLFGCGQPKNERAALGAAASHATRTTSGTMAPRDAADPDPVPTPNAPIR